MDQLVDAAVGTICTQGYKGDVFVKVGHSSWYPVEDRHIGIRWYDADVYRTLQGTLWWLS